MGFDVLNGAQLYMLACDSVTIRFPRKICLSVSTTHAIRPWNRGMKSLEVQNILKSAALRRMKLGSMDEIYQADQHGHSPEVEKENTDTFARLGYRSQRPVSAVIKCPKNL
jgi:hypothetical protein